MLSALSRSYRLTKKRVYKANTSDFRQWKIDQKASVAQHAKDFWEIQTGVENDFIEKYNTAMIRKFMRTSCKHREGVIRISKNTIDLQESREALAQRKESTAARRAEIYAEDFFRKRLLVDAMNYESSSWITLDNLETQITANVLIPNSLDNSSYYTRLREISEIHGLGKMISDKDHYNNRQESQVKNQLLSTYFTDVRSLIKSLSHSPLQPLIEDFEAIKAKLFDYPAKLAEIIPKYEAIYHAWKNQEVEEVDVFVTRTHKQLDLTCKLVKRWNEYINVAKMDDTEVQLLNAQLPSEAPIKVDDSKEMWEGDLLRDNPETSDSHENNVDEEAMEKELSTQMPQEEGNINLDFTSEEIGTDFDMYKGEANEGLTMEESQEKMIDNLMSEVLHDFNNPKEYFKQQESLTKAELDQDAVTRAYSPAATLISIRERIERLADEDLDLQSRWKKGEILQFIEYLTNFKVDEPHMLLKVYKHHRYEEPVFK